MALTKALQKRIAEANKYIKFAQKHGIWGRGYFGSTMESVFTYPHLITVSPTGRSVRVRYHDAYGGGKHKQSFNTNDPDSVSDLRYEITHYVIGAIKRGAKDEGRSIPKTLSNPVPAKKVRVQISIYGPHEIYGKKDGKWYVLDADRVHQLGLNLWAGMVSLREKDWASLRPKLRKMHNPRKRKTYEWTDDGKPGRYKVVEGFDHRRGKPLYQVVGVNNDYAGEWHTSKASAQRELKATLEEDRYDNPRKRKNASKSSSLSFSFDSTGGPNGGAVKFRRGPVGKVGRIEVSVTPRENFYASLYEDVPSWVLMRDYINVVRTKGYGGEVPYATKVKVWKAAQKALVEFTGLPSTPRALPKRKNSDKGEKYAQLFRDLRDKRITTIQLDMKGVMGGGTGGFRTFKRGRMGKPKRWRGGWDKPAFERVSLSVVPLDDMGNPIKMRSGYKLWLSEYDDGTADVSASIGDMGLMLQGMKKNPRKRKNPGHKGEVNPYSKRYTYMDFTKKFWGKNWRDVPRDIRLSFWDDFKLAFVGGLQKYKEATRG